MASYYQTSKIYPIGWKYIKIGITRTKCLYCPLVIGCSKESHTSPITLDSTWATLKINYVINMAIICSSYRFDLCSSVLGFFFFDYLIPYFILVQSKWREMSWLTAAGAWTLRSISSLPGRYPTDWLQMMSPVQYGSIHSLNVVQWQQRVAIKNIWQLLLMIYLVSTD